MRHNRPPRNRRKTARKKAQMRNRVFRKKANNKAFKRLKKKRI
jgi:hypothetical protein